MTRILVVPTLLAMLSLAAPPVLAQAPSTGAGVTQPAAPIALTPGRGRLITLPGPAQTVFVGEPRVADVQVRSPYLVYLVAKAPGATSLIAIDAQGRRLIDADVDVGFDLEALRREIAALAPDSQVRVAAAGATIILSGSAPDADQAELIRTLAARLAGAPERVVNHIRVEAEEQVNLRVRVVEVSRDMIKALGVNWTGAGAPGRFTFGVATGQDGITASTAGLQGLNSYSAGFKNAVVDLNLVIDALDSRGLITVLAEPNLTAASGAKASFLAGGEYPIPVPQGQNQITIEFKRYGVSLDSVATVMAGGRIRLTVKPEVSQLSNSGAVTLSNVTVPALTTRRAETTVDLASGQSFAIAGLLQAGTTHDLQRTPGLGDLIGLGALFRSDRLERREMELIIVVTPYLVRPSASPIATPLDGQVTPTDLERVLRGVDQSLSRGRKTSGGKP